MALEPLKYFDSLYAAETHFRDIQMIIPYLEKGLSCQIVGLPGSGKSNIMRLLAYNRDVRYKNFGEYEKYLHFVYLDCAEIKDKPLYDITKFILISLAFTLSERRMDEEAQVINSYLKEGLEMQDEMMLFQALKRSLDYLSVEKKITVNLLFDRFDFIIPDLTPQFFNNLKILRNHVKYRFGSIFSLVRPIEEVVDYILMDDFYDLIAENIVYNSLSDSLWLDFRASYIEKAARKTFESGVKEEIIKLTGGHSKLSKLSFEAVISEAESIPSIHDFLLKRPTIQKTLQEIWGGLLPSEQLAIKKDISYADAQQEFPYMVSTQLLSENGITIPLFASFIKTVPIESTEKIIYDEEKNEVMLGEIAISEKLSPFEFKLMIYLIQNKEKLCSKDEIINAVWGDQKSQEGVTDQALDQIFYRLRKKIEKDPSNPRYIHTVKGKGYKLSS